MIAVKLIILIFMTIGTVPKSSSLSLYFPSRYEETELTKNYNYRLPNNTIPRLYKINLEPHIDDVEFTFNGTSSTMFQVIHPTENIIVHASALIEIDKTYTRVVDADGKILEPISQNWNSTLEFFILQFDRALDIGNYTVKFKWTGYDAPDLLGFYRAFYNTTGDDNNEITEYLATTQFQPTSARAAFPCWDEPGLKAEFEISVKHYPHYKALSNMPIKNVTTAEDRKVWTNFERSRLMSTYLVVLLVAPYRHHANDHGNITMWAPPLELKNTKFGFEMSLKIVPAMEEYTGIPYSLPKMDQAMISLYPAGATEHWGLISYGHGISFTPGKEDIWHNDLTVTLAAHEIAHQWFGNLVTPLWWNDVWLSEAFATYFQYKILDKVMDNWSAMNLFDTELRNLVAFQAGTGKIKRAVETPFEIEKMFNAATYRKGASVIEMLENTLGEEVFKNGIRKYLNKHKYGSVVTDDVWQALQEAYSEEDLPDLNIKEMMDPWLEQTGYPLLNVTRNYETGIVTVTQTNTIDSSSNNSWTIPINYATASQPNFASTRPTLWLSRSTKSLTISGIDNDDWILFNIQNKGFYRVEYDYENLKRLANYLNSDNYEKIHVINRAQLLYDALRMTSRGPRYVRLMIDMVSYLHRETNYLPWLPLTAVVDQRAIRQFQNTLYYKDIAERILHLMDNILNSVGFDDDIKNDHLSALARKDLLPLACTLNHKGCKSAATRKLVKILEEETHPSRISVYEREEIYCLGLIDANETIWDLMMNIHFSNSQEGYRLLGCTNNHTLIRKYLDQALNKSGSCSTNNIDFAFSSLTENSRENVDFALDYFFENHDIIAKCSSEKNATKGEIIIDSIVRRLGSAFTNDNQCIQLTKFINGEIAIGKMKKEARKVIWNAKNKIAMIEAASQLIHSVLNGTAFHIN